MAKTILKLLLTSCESEFKQLNISEVEEFFDEKNGDNEEEPYYIPETIRKALSVSVTHLISTKVSHQMHQRHTIQQKVYVKFSSQSKIKKLILNSIYKFCFNFLGMSSRVSESSRHLQLPRIRFSRHKNFANRHQNI